MDIFNHLATQHRNSVAFVFSKYGIKKPVTPKNVQRAILAGKNTPFYQDLMNAICLQALGKNYYEDDFDYNVENMDTENFEAETVGIIDTFEFDYLDRAGRKARRKQKKIVRKQKKQAKKASKNSVRPNPNASIQDAEFSDNGSGNFGSSIADKVETGLNVVGQLATAAGGIAGQFLGNKDNDAATADSNSNEDEAATATATANSGVKKYLPYIIGGVALFAVVGVLIFVLKKKK